jgi:predicted lipase
MITTMRAEIINDCGKKPGQLIKFIRSAKIGELIDCKARASSRSMGKDGIVFTIKVSTAKAPMAANNDTWNRNLRYWRFGRDIVSSFAAR